MTTAHRDRLRGTGGDPVLFGVVGLGRVGSALATALVHSGHRLVGACARECEVAARGTDLIVIAVPDDALSGVVQRLAAVVRQGQVVAHTSGVHGVAVLEPLARVGAIPLALHPAMTFSGSRDDADRLLGGVSFGVTAVDEQASGMAQRLVDSMGGRIEWIDEPRRALYHAAMAHGANHLVTLVNESVDLLAALGIADPQAMLSPLLSAALANALRQGDDALTGPVCRGDAGTLAAHLQALGTAAPETAVTYNALARQTVGRAITSGRLTASGAAPLLDLLAR